MQLKYFLRYEWEITIQEQYNPKTTENVFQVDQVAKLFCKIKE